MSQTDKQQSVRPTAKRSPSILVTDARKSQIKAPFAGHRYENQRKNNEQKLTSIRQKSLGLPKLSRVASRYSDISVSNIISDISDIPSSRQREPTLLGSHNPNLLRSGTGRQIPTLSKTLPSRTSKITQKLVLIPDDSERSGHADETAESTTDNIFQSAYTRTRAEQMSKDQRAGDYPRVTAYLIAEGFNLQLTSKFLAKRHMVSPRLYDEMLYVPYSLPLLPGENGYRVQSNNSAKMLHGNQLMENFIDKSEQRDHNYEFYSGEDGEQVSRSLRKESPKIAPVGSPQGNADFDPSEPQFFVSSSPTESIIDSERDESLHDDDSAIIDDGKDTHDERGHETSNDHHPSNQSNNTGHRLGRRFSSSKEVSQRPDMSKLAEMFISDYGVVVFWNFSEIHEKNILADLVFAKIQPGEFSLDDDDEEDDEDDTDNRNNTANDADDGNELDESVNGDTVGDEFISFIIKPVPEHDIETEEFHFEYNKDIPTPRIYNDMISLKSGDHLIKLSISHAIAQSSKLSMFESKMSVILNSISRLPKALALTGKLQNYTRKKLLIKTGKLFQLRNEVNLSSNILDTPEYFWSIEPGLHPLYSAIRDYLEIEQRVEVINDRCKVFLDFFDIVADSLAEKTMNKITYILIMAIGLSVFVSMIEIFIRYLIIRKFTDLESV